MAGDAGLVHQQQQGVAVAIDAQFDQPLAVCGWSLGGQVALRWAALHPGQVNKLVLLASTPCFVQRADWPYAMAAETLQEFAGALLANHAQTLKRFLALQVRGSENERELLASLRSRLFSRGEPDLAALRGGLEILRDTDLRASLAQLRQPTLVVAGERDMLTPLAASQHLAAAMPDARLVSVAGAAHAPFLSHPDSVVEQMMGFLHEGISDRQARGAPRLQACRKQLRCGCGSSARGVRPHAGTA